jgi:hypothetical protein
MTDDDDIDELDTVEPDDLEIEETDDGAEKGDGVEAEIRKAVARQTEEKGHAEIIGRYSDVARSNGTTLPAALGDYVEIEAAARKSVAADGAELRHRAICRERSGRTQGGYA